MFTRAINGKGQEMFTLFIRARMTCMPNYSNSFQFDNINHDNNVFELKLLKTNSCSDLNVVAQKKVQNI
jgi:hypothetical protein